ncbi:unnamed protein product [Cylicostephanus goldi]|uniref:Ion transport domain-containing protein n=1 Tax=Cylicostephanus goldi TaxID=71465 RepID=A0A3P6RXE1_CYLGO|nr:unnamed protein product [Cylicostephanus goldi]
MIFMYCSTLFLMNIFVMIILFEFEEVRNDSSRQTNAYDILDHIQTKAELLLHRVRRWQIDDDDDFIVPPPRAQDVPNRLSFDIF